MSAEQERLEAAIGYSFRDSGLLRRALTHKSYAHEQPATADAVLADNEQLEFLGDAILGFLASELLVSRFPTLAEGRLSKLKARLVSADHLHKVALSLDLGRHLVLGKGEEMSGGRAKPALLADALEAGMIWLNSENVRHLPTPFGGMKSSGIGRDGGDYSFDFYMETKHVSLARGTHKIQRLGI